MSISEINGAGKAESLWTKPNMKKKPVEEQPSGGLTASFAPNGNNFLQTVQSTFSSTNGNNCAGI